MSDPKEVAPFVANVFKMFDKDGDYRSVCLKNIEIQEKKSNIFAEVRSVFPFPNSGLTFLSSPSPQALVSGPTLETRESSTGRN